MKKENEVTNDTISHIDIKPEGYYAASSIIRSGWFPWIKHVQTFRRMLETDEGKVMYKPIVRTAGKYTFYKIKGSTILEIIDRANSGLLKI